MLVVVGFLALLALGAAAVLHLRHVDSNDSTLRPHRGRHWE